MMKRTMGGVLAAAMMMMSALPAAGAVDVSLPIRSRLCPLHR